VKSGRRRLCAGGSGDWTIEKNRDHRPGRDVPAAEVDDVSKLELRMGGTDDCTFGVAACGSQRLIASLDDATGRRRLELQKIG
jgi:hypothetical protein